MLRRDFFDKKQVSDLPKSSSSGSYFRIIPLGGLGEVGKNMTIFETNEEILIVDCGVSFPTPDQLGVDLVIPDFSYLEENQDKIVGLLITHGHEDHIGGIPFLLKKINVPIYATNFAADLIYKKLEQHRLRRGVRITRVSAGHQMMIGQFNLEFVNMAHSTPDSVGIIFKTPFGNIFHTGDWKMDPTPVYGKNTDIPRLVKLGEEGVHLLLCDSTNAEREGISGSELKVSKNVRKVLEQYKENRIIITTFASNLYRIAEFVKIASNFNRKICFAGRSMVNVSEIGIKAGKIKQKSSVISIDELPDYSPNEVVIVTTGNQGEPFSVLSRMADKEFSDISLTKEDVVLFSSSTIPGNEKFVNDLINKLSYSVKTVIYDKNLYHVSGHAFADEIKELMSILKPHYFFPVHGENAHLMANKQNAIDTGVLESRVFIGENGSVLDVKKTHVKLMDKKVKSGNQFVDGNGIGDVGELIIKERRILSESGALIISAAIDVEKREIIAGPEIESRGFIFMKESRPLISQIIKRAAKTIDEMLETDSKFIDIKQKLKDELSSFVYEKTGRRPIISSILLAKKQ